MKIIDLDCGLFTPIAISLHLMPNTRSLTPSMNGYEQVVNGNRSIWKGQLRLQILGKERIPSFRALLAKLEGRTHVLRFCPCDPFGFTPIDAGVASNGLPYSDEMFHSDNMGFAFEPVIIPTMNAAAGATKLIFKNSEFPANGVREGCYFSIDDYLYIITDIVKGTTKTEVQFKPNLRKSVMAGDSVELKPHVLMRLTDDLQGRHTLTMGKFMDEVSLELTEVLGR